MNLKEIQFSCFHLQSPFLTLFLGSGRCKSPHRLFWFRTFLFSRGTSWVLRCGEGGFWKRWTRKLWPRATNVLLKDILQEEKYSTCKELSPHLTQHVFFLWITLFFFFFTSTRRISLARSFTRVWVLMVSGISTSWSAKAFYKTVYTQNVRSMQTLFLF